MGPWGRRRTECLAMTSLRVDQIRDIQLLLTDQSLHRHLTSLVTLSTCTASETDAHVSDESYAATMQSNAWCPCVDL